MPTPVFLFESSHRRSRNLINSRVDMESIAEQLGGQGVERLVSNAEQICIHEQRRIALENEPAIVRRQAEGAILIAEERRIVERLALAPPHGDGPTS